MIRVLLYLVAACVATEALVVGIHYALHPSNDALDMIAFLLGAVLGFGAMGYALATSRDFG